MKQACLVTIAKLADDFCSLEDSLNNLHSVIENDKEDEIEDALNAFPTPANLAKTLEKLGKLIESRPWEDKRRKVQHG